MADGDTQVPELAFPLDIPCLKRGAMEGTQPFIAAPEHQSKLGFPGELVPDWKEKALAKMKELAEKNRAFQVYLDICVKCGACTDKCHYFLGSGDPKNMPVARQDLLLAAIGVILSARILALLRRIAVGVVGVVAFAIGLRAGSGEGGEAGGGGSADEILHGPETSRRA